MACATVRSDEPGSGFEPAYTINPAGTFIPSGQRYIFAENLQLSQDLWLTLQGSVSATLWNLFLTPVVMGALQSVPVIGSSVLAMQVATLLWRFSGPLSFWRLYVRLLAGSWNYSWNRIGRVPIYLSSPYLRERMVMFWDFPLHNEHAVQLELLMLPTAQRVHAVAEEGVQTSPLEQALQALWQALDKRGAVRFLIAVGSRNLRLSVQNQEGEWFYRAIPRPGKLLLAEGLQSWQGRHALEQTQSLLTPGVIEQMALALACREEGMHKAWQESAIPVVRDNQVTIFQLAADDHQCDYLEVADKNSNLFSFGGYMHLNTGQPCGEANTTTELYAQGQREAALSEQRKIVMIPRWQTALLFKAMGEVVAYGTSQVYHSVHYSNRPHKAVFTVSPLESAPVGQIQNHALRCLSLIKPAEAQEVVRGDVCRWRRAD